MFEDPRLSTNFVDAAAIRRYNFFKGFVLVFLAALLLGLWGLGRRYAQIEAPTITAPTGTLSPGVATLAGTGTAASVVEVWKDGGPIGLTTVDADGNWSLETADLAAGEYQYTARAFDPDGEMRGESAPFSLLVEAPDVEVVVQEPTDDGSTMTYEPPTVELPSGDLDPNALMLGGTSTPGSSVEIFQDGVSLGTVDVGDDGRWSLETAVTSYLTEFEAIGYDPDGNNIGSSGIYPLSLAAVALPLSVTTPELGAFALGDDGLPNGRFSVMGEGEPGSTVELFIDGELIGTTTVGEDGNWSFDGDISLPTGEYELVANQILPDGAEHLSASIGLNIPTVGDALAIGELNVDDSGMVMVSGRGTPGTMVDMIVNGEVVDTVTVDEDGNWSWLPSFAYEAGDYDFQVGLSGDADSVTDGQTFSIAPFVTVGDLMVGEAVDGVSAVEINGRSLPNATVEIYIDGDLVATVTADDQGNWSYQTELPTDKSYKINARVIDQSGAVVAESERTMAVGTSYGQLVIAYGGTSAAADDEDGTTSYPLAGVPAVEVILDASWSMNQGLGAQSRFKTAQAALNNIVNDILPENTPFSLRVFGNIEGNYACRTDLMVPYSVLDRTAVNTVINNAAPQFNANTPIAASLALVAEDLADSREEERIVVLLTDGEETCDGDPAAAIQDLVDAGINVQVNIVGLAVADDQLKAEFERWAEIGGGVYYDVSEPAQLVDALQAAFGAIYLVNDEAGNLVAIGRVGSQPLDLAPGTYTVEVRTSPSTLIEDVEIVDGEIIRMVLR